MKKGKRASRNGSKKQQKPTLNNQKWEELTMNPPPMPSSKKPKLADVPEAAKSIETNDMEWSSVELPTYISGADEEIGGMVSLQEAGGIGCEWVEDKETGGRTLRFTKAQQSKGKNKKKRSETCVNEDEEDIEDAYGSVNWDDFVYVDDYSEEKAEKGELTSIGERMRSAPMEDGDEESVDEDEDMDENVEAGSGPELEPDQDEVDPEVDVSAWQKYGVHTSLLRALKHLGFSAPTEIQAKTLPRSLYGSDIIGAAETGSGKTLAFGIPMLQDIANRGSSKWESPTGLVLTPTRELAIQVKDHLVAMSRFLRARVVAIVGGMAQAKQERLLSTNPDIIVATPGRLWDLVSTNDQYLSHVRSIKYLAIDEADRMLEPGHFKELKFIFKAVNESTLQSQEHQRRKRQTFVFSATLLKDMQLHTRKQSAKAQKRNQGKPKPGSMEDLIDRVSFQDKNPVFVDVTHPDATAQTLVEARIDCVASDKDCYLYYFLTRYPGRTLVFVNSIDSIRRMLPMLRLLKVNVFGLHAQMEQRQRLKSVDRFRDNNNAVLVASDVAARGLDIPQVDYVIHYQIPRSGDLYVHRSGRTARAQKEGLAIMMVSPEERKLYRKMCEKLDKNIAQFPVDLDLMGRLRPRVTLAREIELKEHKLNKQTHERNWFKKNAEELDIELDSDFMPSSDDERGSEQTRSDKQQRLQVKSLKSRLNQMLATKIMTRGVSERYLSSGVISDLAERLSNTSNSANAAIPTLLKESALEAVKRKISK